MTTWLQLYPLLPEQALAALSGTPEATPHARKRGYNDSKPHCTLQGADDELKAPTACLITLLLVVYIYDEADDTFKQLPGMPAHIPLQIHNAKRLRSD